VSAREASGKPLCEDVNHLDSILAKRRPLDRGRGFTDADNAERYIAQFGRVVIYVPGVGWLIHDGQRWRDGSGDVIQLAIEAARHIAEEEPFAAGPAVRDLYRHAANSLSAPRIHAAIDLAASHPAVRLDVNRLDADPWKFNCRNGTIDLRTGKLYPHDPADFMTYMSPVEYQPHELLACGPHRFGMAVREIFKDNPAVAVFVQRFLGYCLTGLTAAHIFAIASGKGGNGKSILVEATRSAYGDYAAAALDSTFMVSKGDKIPNDLARMRGKRLVIISETTEGRALDESLIKRCTGDEVLSARHFYQAPFEFKPQFKPLLISNHLPEIKGRDDGIWRRIRVVPFNQKFPQDEKLLGILQAEPEFILAWLVQGCLDWQAHGGLSEVAAINDAVAQYRTDSDPLSGFLAERCTVAADAACRFTTLYAAFAALCRDDGSEIMPSREFGKGLRERGFLPYLNNGRCYRGLSLKVNDTQPMDDRRVIPIRTTGVK